MRIQLPNKKISKFLLINIKIEDGKKSFRYALLSGKRKSFQLEDASSLKEIIEKAGKSNPIVLHLSGFGVLTRIVEKTSNYKDTLIISGDKDDFYFNSIDLNNTIAVSFVRKKLIQDCVDELAELKTYLWGIHIGPIPVLFGHESNLRITLDYEIEIAGNEIKKLEKVEPNKSEFLIQDKYTHRMHAVCFSDDDTYIQGLPIEQFETTKFQFKEYRRFISLGIFILTFFLITLSGNYFYVNFLYKKLANLETEISSYGENLSMIDRLTQEKNRKQVLVDNSGVQGKTYLSFYLDKIGASIPQNLRLTAMEVFPLIENLKPKMKVELNYSSIVVHGFTANSMVLDDWMEKLETKDWINGVELMNYVRLSESRSKFHLLIKLIK